MKKRSVATFQRSHESRPVNIVSDAAIATGRVGDGRLIPVLIVDAEERPDIEELVRVHRYLPTGDVGCQWAQIRGHEGTISLILRFMRPAEVAVVIEFDIARQGGIVDSILSSKAVYLQPGKSGDRLSLTMENPRILVEVGDAGFSKDWDEMLFKHICRRLRGDGLSRAEPKRAAKDFIQEWRKITRLRMPNEADGTKTP